MDLVTGGTGFVGAHVVRALLARGRAVRCLVRRGSRRDNLEGLDVEIVFGDVTDRVSLSRALAGVATLYHCAADYRLWAADPGELTRVNVAGTRERARRRGGGRCREGRLHELGRGARPDEPTARPPDETTPVDREEIVGRYKKSKYDAERVAEAWAARGLPVVIVNPSTPVGRAATSSPRRPGR